MIRKCLDKILRKSKFNKDLNERIDLLFGVLQGINMDLTWMKRVDVETEDKLRDIFSFVQKLSNEDQKHRVKFNAESTLAIDSNDHKFPCGTKNDNTRYPRFVKKCEDYFGRKINLLDLGCAGGGLVLDFLLYGHRAYGIEGSNYSLINQRAEWRSIPNNLFVADITKPFDFRDDIDQRIKFDLITMWEVLEHIKEKDLPGLIENIVANLTIGGLFVASIGLEEQMHPTANVKLHHTVKSVEWWQKLFYEYNFVPVADYFVTLDFPRGSGNPRAIDCNYDENPKMGGHLVLKKVK